MTTEARQWPQILLTNSIDFGEGRRANGASAFLLLHDNDTTMCTARHLLSPDMGIVPEVPEDSVDLLLEEWLLYPRHNKLKIDTIHVRSLKVYGRGEKDIVVFNLESGSAGIQVLKPRVKKVSFLETLFLIGCPYTEPGCRQNVYKIAPLMYHEGDLLAECAEPNDISGFSGAPVIDENGYVVGVLTGMAETDTERFLVIEPISSAIDAPAFVAE